MREPFLEANERFDHVKYGVACREIQVMIVNGNHDAAMALLKRFIRECQIKKAKLDTPIALVAPPRISRPLFDRGIRTIGDIEKLEDADFLVMRNFGRKSLDACRRLVVEAKAGTLMIDPKANDDDQCNDLELDYPEE